MKKYVISFFTICTFAAYVLFEKFGTNQTALQSSQLASNTLQDTLSSVSTSLNLGEDDVPVKKVTTPKPVAPVAPVATVPKTTTPAQSQGKFKNGTYTGSVADAYYGNVQVQAVVKNGKLSNIAILDYPQDRSRSASINSRAMPILVSEAIQAQSANVNTVSGATDSSGAFRQSLDSALSQALI